MIIDVANSPLSELDFQVKQIKAQLKEAQHLYNQRKMRVSMMLDTWMRYRDFETSKITKLEKVLWEKLNIGTSIHVILEQIDKIYEEL